MASEPERIPVAVCESCWLVDNTNWEPESMDESGQVMLRMTGIKVPVKINLESPDVCYSCGAITVAGIYELRDAAKVKHLDLHIDTDSLNDSNIFLVDINTLDEDEDEDEDEEEEDYER